jgi:hypothetical protein
MKINVLKDKKGKVIATFEKAVGDAPSVAPVLEEGHKVEEMDVDPNYKADLKAFYQKHG